MRKFCYRCGTLEQEGGPLINGLCQQCFSKENRLLRAPAEIAVTFCGRCGAYKLGRRWQTAEGDSLLNAIKITTFSIIRLARFTPSGIKLLRPAEAPDIELSIEPRIKEESIVIKAIGKVHELETKPHVEEANLRFELKRTTCDVCMLKSAHHYEAILQVRGELTGKKRSEIRAALEKLAEEESRRERKAFISRIEERKEGLDFYVNPVGLARKMAGLLKSEFGAKVEESAKLVGQTKDGRRKYKLSILAKLLNKGSF